MRRKLLRNCGRNCLKCRPKRTLCKLGLQQLDESIKPENIERSLAGIGSTRPEELRETRRRQLTIERDGVLAQLKTLETEQAAFGNRHCRTLKHSRINRVHDPLQMMAASSAGGYQRLMLGGGGLALSHLAGAGALFLPRRIDLFKIRVICGPMNDGHARSRSSVGSSFSSAASRY